MEDEHGEQRRRLPSIQVKISEIRQDYVRAGVTGVITDVHDSGIIVDDGTGSINVGTESAHGFGVGRLVRVLGRVIPAEGGAEIRAEFIQGMDGLDLGLLERARKAVKRIQ